MEPLLAAIEETDSWCKDRDVFKEKHLKKFKKEILPTLSGDNWDDIEKIILACVTGGYEYVVEVAVLILKRRNLVNWKAHPETVEKILDTILGFAGEQADDHNDQYSDFMEILMQQLKSKQLVPQFSDKLFAIMTLAIIDETNNRLNFASLQIVVGYPWKEDLKMCKRVLTVLFETVQEYPNLPQENFRAVLADNALVMVTTFVIVNSKAGEIAETMAKILEFCIDQEWYDTEDTDMPTLSHQFVAKILGNYIGMCSQDRNVLQHTIKYVKMLKECGEDELERDANYILGSAGNLVDFSKQEVQDTLDSFIQRYDVHIIQQVLKMYPQDMDAYHKRFDELLNLLDNMGDVWQKVSVLGLFLQIVRANPQVFTKESITLMVRYSNDQQLNETSLMILRELAQKRPADVSVHDDALLSIMLNDISKAGGITQMLIHMADLSEEKATKYISFLAGNVHKFDTNTQKHILHAMVTMSRNNRELLVQNRKLFEKLADNPSLRAVCENAINFLEGRSFEDFSVKLAEQKVTLDVMEKRVGVTEDTIGQLDEDMGQTKKQVEYAQKDIKRTEQKLEEVVETVEDVEGKVEDLDRKTLSHAPRWSRDVSKLLNPEDEHDWRLLASRLGYSADDVRNWATQADPCMSMLDEWFATHKTSEATNAVLKSLEEMNRVDAAEIVGRALASVEDIVDDEPAELTNPPPIFISYQWGHQDEVKLLKKHLGMAGYDAWMDIGQMGGGDKLFAKIDEGIRAAKVVVCCVTDKYAQSPNCIREVNLSTTLGKPVVPLLMEKMQWPPPGSMGPIFAEYLFIRFFQRDSELTKDERYWPKDKFQELLMQLRYSIPPDMNLLTDGYKEWWNPPAEVIVIKPRKNMNPEKGNLVLAGYADGEVQKSPEIFISYQWGKQPQIKALYKRLTSLGYNCWFDIMQMGGGDSLYDKIDTGVRGCDVMLSCVTTKYSKSANCRREVSLADAIKKPIIPLLLEETTWPPEGPMGMVFTQLLYVNFCKPSTEIQNTWDGPAFEDLLKQITVYVPEIRNNVKSVSQRKKKRHGNSNQTSESHVVVQNHESSCCSVS